MKDRSSFKTISLSMIWLWFGIFTIFPMIIIVFSSFLSYDSAVLLKFPLTFDNYKDGFNVVYFRVFLHSLYVAFVTTFICLLVSYPFALTVSRVKSSLRSILLILVVVPFWTSSLLRTYAIMVILKSKGLLNAVLLSAGLIHKPLALLYSQEAVFVGLVYDLLPFMILPLYANMERLDNRLIEAAMDLGAGWFTIFYKIILPLTKPGIFAGILMVFFPAMTLFFIPDILGGAKSLLIGNLIQNQFLEVSNWPMGSSVSVILIILMAVGLVAYWFLTRKRNGRFLI